MMPGETQNNDIWPIPAFYFKVAFHGAKNKSDTAFQEISGIGSQLDTDEVFEGGENRFSYHLPKAVKHTNVVFKRGIAELDSFLVKWCKTFFEGDFKSPLVPKDLSVHLLGEKGTVIRSWNFFQAYPVNWKVDGFHSTKNEVAIEEIELCYQYSNRVM
ncbi:phage tail protein [Shewanella surugensis]|uniref:Phage tail protein n=1 Tax=Shewanella surugensis TaxID=212020 RepID=A0ABT0L8S1_9GAMM|nr:phage tail protein [Shewanella surugensis]MCL1123747.1 phage tail protein [Shewanella surugensis]